MASLILVAGGFAAGSAGAAPVSVASINRGLDPAPAGAVRCSRFRDGIEVAVESGMVLAVGDRIWSVAEGVDLRLACGEDSDYMLSGRFQAFVDFPGEAACSLEMIAGDAEVLTDQPVTTDIGGVVMSNEGTQYSVRLGEAGERAEVLVFDGLVRATAAGRSAEIRTGSALRLEGGGRVDGLRRRLAPADAERSAAIYARTDMAVAGGPHAVTGDGWRRADELARLHFDVLTDPGNEDARAALARTQIRLGLCDEAFYHLKRGDLLKKRRLREHDIDRAALERGLSPGHRAELDKALRGGGLGKALGAALVIGAAAVLVNEALDDDDENGNGDRRPDPHAGGGDPGNRDPKAGRVCDEISALIAAGEVYRAEEIANTQIQRQQPPLSCHYWALAKASEARDDGFGFARHCKAALELHGRDGLLTRVQVRDCGGFRVQ